MGVFWMKEIIEMIIPFFKSDLSLQQQQQLLLPNSLENSL